MRRWGIFMLGIGILVGMWLSAARAGETRRVRIGTLNLNTASQQDLQLLPGVGQVRAYKIVRFRRQIGGFKAVADLRRVPEVGAALFARIQDYLRLSGENNLRVLIDLNSATPSALGRLPNVSPQQADAIIAYREQHAGFERVEDLVRVGGMDARRFEELRELVTVLPWRSRP